MILNGVIAVILHYFTEFAAFGANYVKVVEDRPTQYIVYEWQKVVQKNLVLLFSNTYGDILRGFWERIRWREAPPVKSYNSHAAKNRREHTPAYSAAVREHHLMPWFDECRASRRRSRMLERRYHEHCELTTVSRGFIKCAACTLFMRRRKSNTGLAEPHRAVETPDGSGNPCSLIIIIIVIFVYL